MLILERIQQRSLQTLEQNKIGVQHGLTSGNQSRVLPSNQGRLQKFPELNSGLVWLQPSDLCHGPLLISRTGMEVRERGWGLVWDHAG